MKGSVNEDIINKQGSNISDNPTFYNNCYEAISSLKEEDLENFKKLTEFYGFNFEEEATNNAIENIIDNYNKNNSLDYNNGDALLAIYLSNDEYTLSKTLTEKILETLKVKIKKVKKNEIDETLNKELEIIETCKYLKDSDIKKIKTEGKEIANTTTDNIIKETKDKITTTILTIISTILLAVLEIVCINFIIKFSYIILDRALMVLILVPAIVIGIIVLLVKNLKNKNKILKSAIIIISIILSIYGKITLTKIDEFRKDKVLIKYEAIDDTFKWVTKGTPIDLTIPENQQGDEGVQGWANKEGKFYINGITATENTKLFLSEAAGTVANGFATVTFKFENGQPDFSYKQYVGSWINVPQDPYKEGYTFTGWSTGNYTPVIHKETLLQGDLVVYARYQKN